MTIACCSRSFCFPSSTLDFRRWMPRTAVALVVLLFVAAPQCRADGPDSTWAPSPVLGLYSVPASACSLAAAAGFKIISSYDFSRAALPDSTPFIQAARTYLDAAHHCGLRVMLPLPKNWLAQRLEGPVRTVVRSLHRHPAILAWYEDETAQEGDLGAVQFLNKVVTEEDPAHGLIIEEAIRDPELLHIGRVRMFTFYATTAKARKQGALGSLRQRFPVETLHVPFWPVLQGYGQDLIGGHPSPDLVAPSRLEL